MKFLSLFNKNKALFDFLRITLLIFIGLYIIFSIANFLDIFIENITCGAELFETKNDGGTCFVSNEGYHYDNANRLTTEKSFSGNYSVKLTETDQFGFSITLDIPKPNETYEMSVWLCNTFNKDSSGFATIVASSGQELWQGAFNVIDEKLGWKKISTKFIVSDKHYTQPLVIYCWNNTKNDVFFDDMTITRKNWKVIFKN